MNPGQPAFRELFEHAMLFLSNPRALWDSGRFEYRQTVLKLCFAQAPQYCRKEGFRTPVSAYPFRLLRELCGRESQMAEGVGFEPTERSHAQRFSRPPHSTTLPPLRRRRSRLAGWAEDRNARARLYGPP